MNIQTLYELQKLPLTEKIKITKERIIEWHDYWDNNVYVSFSGGRDSTVLLDIARSIFPDIPAMFVNTGLEYPEIISFVKKTNNVKHTYPKIPFSKVIKKYGYPVVSKSNAQILHEIRTTKSKKLLNKRMNGDAKGNGKLPEKWKFLIKAPFKISHKCCDILKKNPSKKYEKDTGNKGMLGTMAVESRQRTFTYLQNGCNSFTSNRPISTPIGFWTFQDIIEYIKKYNIKYSNIYKTDKNRRGTGCMFCLFGIHLEPTGFIYKNRFQKMKLTHPKHYKYCMNNLKLRKVLKYLKIRQF